MAVHSPAQPSWDCRRCGDPWPCEARKVEMVEEFGEHRVAGSMYLASNYIEAMEDLCPAMPAGAVHERFMGWWRDLKPVT